MLSFGLNQASSVAPGRLGDGVTRGLRLLSHTRKVGLNQVGTSQRECPFVQVYAHLPS